LASFPFIYSQIYDFVYCFMMVSVICLLFPFNPRNAKTIKWSIDFVWLLATIMMRCGFWQRSGSWCKIFNKSFQINYCKLCNAQPDKKDIVSCGELDSTIFDRFCAADYYSLYFWPMKVQFSQNVDVLRKFQVQNVISSSKSIKNDLVFLSEKNVCYCVKRLCYYWNYFQYKKTPSISKLS
jgi:hypothetical protein